MPVNIWSTLTVHHLLRNRHLHSTRPCFSFLTFYLRQLELRHQRRSPRFRSPWPHQTLLLISSEFSLLHFRSKRIYLRQLLWHFLLWSSLQICVVNLCGQNRNSRQSSDVYNIAMRLNSYFINICRRRQIPEFLPLSALCKFLSGPSKLWPYFMKAYHLQAVHHCCSPSGCLTGRRGI